MKALLKALFLGPWLVMALAPMAANADQLETISERGSIEAAVYRDFPPFSYRNEKGKRAGIDVEIAELVAEKLGVNLSARFIGVDENMEDDLRNNIWKGHYIGGGVADFMMHVPYDLAFAAENDLVAFIAPYYRDSLALAVNTDTADAVRSASDIDQHKVGVELDTLADFYLLSPRHGNRRDNVVHFTNISEAAAAFARGEIDAIAGPSAEVQGVMQALELEFDLRPLPTPGLRSSGWDVGLGIRFNHKSLINAVIGAMQALGDEGAIAAVFERHGVDYQPASAESIATGFTQK